jgi:hypothetical protein
MEIPVEIPLFSKLIEVAKVAQGKELHQLQQFFEQTLVNEKNHLTALYGSHILALREQDFDKAFNLFHRALHAWYFRYDYVSHLLAHLSITDQLQFVSDYISRYLDDPYGYLLKLGVYRNSQQLALFRECMAQCYEHASKGVHFQPSVIASVFDATKGVDFRMVGEPVLGELFR